VYSIRLSQQIRAIGYRAPERFAVIDDWLTARRRAWEARLDRFDEYVTQLKEKESGS